MSCTRRRSLEDFRMKCPWASVTIAFLLALSIAPVNAQSTSDKWQVTVVPYLMAAGLNGTVGARGFDTNINASVSDVLSHLEFGAMGIVAARKGAWVIGADVVYVELSATAERPPANVDFDQTALAFYGARSLGSAVEARFGLRINRLEGQLDFTHSVGVVTKEAEWWVDPIVGLLVRSPDGRRAQFRLYTEIGGFGAGSEVAWQVFPNAGIRLTERLGFEFGYRALGTDYESGEEGDHFVWDTVMHGPAVGLTIRF